MNIKIISNEGGVGKSTLALIIAKSLALKSKKVALLDMDLLGYPSWVIGVEGNGIITTLLKNKDYKHAIKEIEIGKGSITTLKLFDGKEITDLDRNILIEAMNIINDTLRNFKYVITDTPTMSFRERIKQLEPEGKSLMITRYSSEIPSVTDSDTLGIIVNMVPDNFKTFSKHIKNEIVIPFYEQLFNFSGNINEIPIFDEISKIETMFESS
ncbi:P-loop NTPase [Acidianus brierleyi]|uniref:CobQ/CobB/MinD/ParA nucleotide binding domain-containing protein n=1 Tax=Acidianus brierleyi TaxID=41673 RepID=A0A2U9IB44_9CREN|nr:P-loop NTPase [Acidianus brierleyi]AWR93246.1 P-loop NTPase [Acidianus brierleyi]